MLPEQVARERKMDMKRYRKRRKTSSSKVATASNGSSVDIAEATANQISELQPVGPKTVLLKNENLKDETFDVLVEIAENAGFHENEIVEDISSQQLVPTCSKVPQPVPTCSKVPQLVPTCKDKEKDTMDDVIYLRSEKQFPRRSRRTRVITPSQGKLDTGKLDTGKFEFYCKNLWEKYPVKRVDSFAYLDCLWFSLYMEGHKAESVLNWIKKKKIFSKRYVIIPIILWGHWSLLILCHFGARKASKLRTPCMLLLDSLQTNSPRLEPGIRKFVLDLNKMADKPKDGKEISQIPLLVPKVPQQRNGKDCGKYVLYYINLFIQNAPANFNISKGYPYFLKEDWFTDEAVDLFCQKLESSASVPSRVNLD